MLLQAPQRLPVTVVTGFLGAGKTTLLRHLLLHSRRRLAVVVNEFGEVGIDGDLLRSCGFCNEEEIDGRLVELANGCLCCTVQDDFLPTMETLLARSQELDGILVETSGLALPEPLLAAFQWPQIRSRTWVNGVVAVVDGEALAQGAVVSDPATLEAQRLADPSLDHAPAIEALFDEQLRCADLVLVSRADLLSAGDLERVAQRIEASVRPGTAMLPMERGAVDDALVLGIAPTGDGAETAEHFTRSHEHRDDDHSHSHGDDHHHDHDQHHDHGHDHVHVPMESVVLRVEGKLDRHALESTLLDLIRSQGLIRVKGRLRQVGKARPLEIQAVGPRLESWYADAGSASEQGPAGLELVVLGFGLQQELLQASLAALV
ncbi:MAG: cobalamin biosynthesis protein CobW [Cyanobium sp.]|nr:cobalamin biosynthesis protein CobW [Cyanobium sp.]